MEGKIYEGPGNSKVTREEIVKHYEGWESEVQELLKVIHLVFEH